MNTTTRHKRNTEKSVRVDLFGSFQKHDLNHPQTVVLLWDRQGKFTAAYLGALRKRIRSFASLCVQVKLAETDASPENYVNLQAKQVADMYTNVITSIFLMETMPQHMKRHGEVLPHQSRNKVLRISTWRPIKTSLPLHYFPVRTGAIPYSIGNEGKHAPLFS